MFKQSYVIELEDKTEIVPLGPAVASSVVASRIHELRIYISNLDIFHSIQ